MAADLRDEGVTTSYASDAGDQISVWVPSQAHSTHLTVHYTGAVNRAASAIGRPGVRIRYVVAGLGDEDSDEED